MSTMRRWIGKRVIKRMKKKSMSRKKSKGGSIRSRWTYSRTPMI